MRCHRNPNPAGGRQSGKPTSRDRFLESAGAIATVANRGAEALELLIGREETPSIDLVLIDLQMRAMDGFTATKLLRNDPATAQPSYHRHDSACSRGRAPTLPGCGMNDHV